MFNEYSTYYITKVRSWAFLASTQVRQGQDILLEIYNHSRHTFSQYSKEEETCQNGLSFVIPPNPIQARLFYRLKVQE